jgi:hypothetical protein
MIRTSSSPTAFHPKTFPAIRVLTFPVLAAFLLSAWTAGVQILLDELFGGLTGSTERLAIKSAVTQARRKSGKSLRLRSPQ